MWNGLGLGSDVVLSNKDVGKFGTVLSNGRKSDGNPAWLNLSRKNEGTKEKIPEVKKEWTKEGKK